MRRKKPARFLPLFSLIPLLLPTPLPAGFTIETGQVSHEKQSLSGEGDCGDVAKNALLDILNATAVTMNSEKQSLQNCGSIFGNWYELSPSEVLALINSYGRCNNITNNGTIRATSSFGLQLFNEAGESSIAIIDGQSQLLTAIRSQGCWVKINNRNSLTACANFAATLCSATNSGTTTLIASDIELTSAAILSRGEDAIAVNRGSVLSRSSATTLLSAFALDEGGSAQLTAEKIHATAYGVLSEGVRAKIWEKKSTVVEAVNSLTLSQQEPDARPLPQLSDIKAAGYGIGAKGEKSCLLNEGTLAITSDLSIINFLNVDLNQPIQGTEIVSSSTGIRSFGESCELENSGLISAHAKSYLYQVPSGLSEAYGLLASGCGSTLRNRGSLHIESSLNSELVDLSPIDLLGTNAYGIYSTGCLSRVQNSGKITANSYTEINSTQSPLNGIVSSSYGIFTSGDETCIKNSGKIKCNSTSQTPSGTETLGSSYGIYAQGSCIQVENSGRIQAVEAIHLYGNRPTLVLVEGSLLEGEVTLNGSTETQLQIKRGLNLSLLTDQPWDHVKSCSPHVVEGNRVVALDKSPFALQNDLLDDLSCGIFAALYDKGCCYQQPDGCRTLFARGFGSYRGRGERGCLSDYDKWQGGALAGIESRFCDRWHLGLFGGASSSTTKQKSHIFELDADSAFGGLYSKYWCNNGCLQFAIVGGEQNQEETRRIMNNELPSGKEKATSRCDGWFCAADAALSCPVTLCQKRIWLKGELRYSILHLDEYCEKGSAATFSCQTRDIQLATVRAESWVRCMNECNLLFIPYIALEGRFKISESDVEGHLAGHKVAFCDGADGAVGALSLGVRGEWMSRCGLAFDYDVEGKGDSSCGYLIRGYVGLHFAF